TAHEREVKSQQLVLEVPDQPVVLDADTARLQQVFANLLSNAARYTPVNGRVWVTVERTLMDADSAGGAHGGEPLEQASATVRIRDNGMGIDSAALSQLFELFSQGEQTPEKGLGLGIGLNLAKRLIELHGGTIGAASTGKNQGSEFVVVLPV